MTDLTKSDRTAHALLIFAGGLSAALTVLAVIALFSSPASVAPIRIAAAVAAARASWVSFGLLRTS